MSEIPPSSGTTEVVILIKAAPQVGERHGETVCCAGLDRDGNWLRLYPISFRQLDANQKFKRWERIRFNWRKPKRDRRIESRRVDQDTIEIIGSVTGSEKQKITSNSIVKSLRKQFENGQSLALIRPEIIDFFYEKKSESDLNKEKRRFELMRRQSDFFARQAPKEYSPCPYRFKYRYEIEDGLREGTCQDWEIETTYFNWLRIYGERTTLEKIMKKFGEEIPKRGLVFAMGTHSLYPDRWLINGIIQMPPIEQLDLF